jgi:uncharacterized cupin superfamily protein
LVEEARLAELESGLAPTGDGWFVVNVRDTAWLTSEAFGAAGVFEGESFRFADVGFTVGVFWPGQPSGLYHSETNQEDFFVLAGECLLLVEGEERQLHTWDFVHCPPGTDHIFIGAGDGPCVIFMTGGRTRKHEVVYPRSELALRHGAGAQTETTSAGEAYAPFPRWQLRRPENWDGLPWA